MATNYPSDYDNRSRVQPGISREGRSAAPVRRAPSGQRPASGARPAYGTRSASGTRASSGARAASGQRQAPARRAPQPSRKGGRRKQPNRAPLFAALALVVVVLVVVIAKPFGRKEQPAPTPQTPAQPAFNQVETPAQNVEVVSDPATLAEKLADSDYELGSL